MVTQFSNVQVDVIIFFVVCSCFDYCHIYLASKQ